MFYIRLCSLQGWCFLASTWVKNKINTSWSYIKKVLQCQLNLMGKISHIEKLILKSYFFYCRNVKSGTKWWCVVCSCNSFWWNSGIFFYFFLEQFLSCKLFKISSIHSMKARISHSYAHHPKYSVKLITSVIVYSILGVFYDSIVSHSTGL